MIYTKAGAAEQKRNNAQEPEITVAIFWAFLLPGKGGPSQGTVQEKHASDKRRHKRNTQRHKHKRNERSRLAA